jgi:cation diffusion facilitator family transporter
LAPQDNFTRARRVLLIVLLLNWSVSAAKIAVGYFINSLSMIADGFHSLLDGASNIIGLVGLTVAAKERDEVHPYGHKKYETFTAVGIALLLFLTCFEVLELALRRLMNPQPIEVAPASFGVMFVTILVNFFVSRYERRKGEELSSDVLQADAAQTRSDIFVSLSVIATLALVKAGYPQFDLIIAIAIAVVIGHAGFRILRRSSMVLVDRMVLDKARVEEVCANIEGIEKCHRIRTRGRPDDINIDLHIVVNQEMRVEEAHALAHRLERELKQRIPGVTDVQIHIEPY